MWGSPRIVGEMGKIGIDVAKSTVEKYMVRHRKPSSPTWRAFLKNHVKDIIAVDVFAVPTVRDQVLFVFLLLAHDRRRVLHFNVTANPTAAWTAQQQATHRGRVVESPEIGGLHHHCQRVAA
jgi:putative transposase